MNLGISSQLLGAIFNLKFVITFQLCLQSNNRPSRRSIKDNAFLLIFCIGLFDPDISQIISKIEVMSLQVPRDSTKETLKLNCTVSSVEIKKGTTA